MHTFDFDLSGKTALITGASGGLGEAFACCLSQAGVRVILAARRLDQCQILAKELKNAIALEINVADKLSVQKAFKYIESTGEKIDILINNAGIAKSTSVFEGDEDNDFENIIQTNVMGVWYMTKSMANHMKQHGIHGSIINIGSINGEVLPSSIGASYNASKAAVMHLTKSLVNELSPYNIRINAISPGFFPTDMTKSANADDFLDDVVKKIPLGFIPKLSDLDGTILYLASNKMSRYVTGTIITVDGGISWCKFKFK
jgi:NAD(P)-dependent dehydrogenase (short-subunit alcohol dehydrogenase family)